MIVQFLCLALFLLSNNALADLGIAGLYNSHEYKANACGVDVSQLPANSIPVFAGNRIWENGAGCGMMYEITCISTSPPGFCFQGQTIDATVVGEAPSLTQEPSNESVDFAIPAPGLFQIASSNTKFLGIDFKKK